MTETLSAALNKQAQFAIEAGDLDKAELILAEAERPQTFALERHALDAAKTLALRGGIALARQCFGEAVESFAAAAEILPTGHEEERFAYLNAEADAFYRQGNESRGVEAFELAISASAALGHDSDESWHRAVSDRRAGGRHRKAK